MELFQPLEGFIHRARYAHRRTHEMHVLPQNVNWKTNFVYFLKE